MRKLLLFTTFVVLCLSAKAQQRPQYSQYMINPFILNPAVAGTENYADLRVGYRNQWVGFNAHPVTMYVSGHAPIGKSMCTNPRTRYRKPGFHGVGGMISMDKTGPSKRLSAYASYAYHLRVAKDLYISLGVSGGIQQYRLDPTMLDIGTGGAVIGPDGNVSGNYLGVDNLFLNNKNFYVATVPDFTAGTWIYSSNFFAGASMSQVLAPNLAMDFFGQGKSGDLGKLTHHYFIITGYRFKVDRDLAIIPSFTIKGVSPAPMSFDVNCKVRYKDAYWAGMSYRRGDAVSAMGGVVINSMFDISYAYDITTSDIRKYTNGVHEVIIGYRVPMKQNLICPSHFW